MSFQKTIIESLKEDCEVRPDGNIFEKEKVFSPEESLRYLTQPVSIIIENSLNDSYFFKALFRCFDNNSIILNSYEKAWIQFENSGGCSNIINYLNSRFQFYQGKSKFFRCIVILDSDLITNQTQTNKYEKEILSFENWDVTYHILEKRMMENYMPDEAIKKLTIQNQWINAYLSLKPEQKDFYNICNGFIKGSLTKGKSRKNRKKDKQKGNQDREGLPKEIKDLFRDVSDQNFEHLKHGFKYPNFKAEFPKLFEDVGTIHKKTFMNRVAHQKNPNELHDIVNKVRNLL